MNLAQRLVAGLLVMTLVTFGSAAFYTNDMNGKAIAATNTPTTSTDISDPVNSSLKMWLWEGTCSSSSPEAFSIAVTEQTEFWGDWDTFEIWCQISAVTGEWIIEPNYIHIQTDVVTYPGIKDSLQATITGADASSPWYVIGRNFK